MAVDQIEALKSIHPVAKESKHYRYNDVDRQDVLDHIITDIICHSWNGTEFGSGIDFSSDLNFSEPCLLHQMPILFNRHLLLSHSKYSTSAMCSSFTVMWTCSSVACGDHSPTIFTINPEPPAASQQAVSFSILLSVSFSFS
jgi:hypothetical protein